MTGHDKDARAKRAKAFINKTVPAVLKSNARARLGVEAVELLRDPAPFVASPKEGAAKLKDEGKEGNSNEGDEKELKKEDASSSAAPVNISLRVTDTLEAASRLVAQTSNNNHESVHRKNKKHARIAILNMASPLRPGGGVLTGATSQEEHLCARTTLYPSLHEDFYRLPEIGAIYTSDVLICRHWDEEATEIPAQERFFVDVITAAMLRFPDVEVNDSGETVYAEARDREMAIHKMRAVMRILRAKGVGKVVLGAWGCGAYKNPVGEIARAWRTVLMGGKSRKGKGGDDGTKVKESWDGMEIVFAIKEAFMAERFASAFGDGLVVQEKGE